MSSGNNFRHENSLDGLASDYGIVELGSPAGSRMAGRIRRGDRFSDDRGVYADRRKPTLKSFFYGAFRPRRRKVRREEDRDHTFLDVHPNNLLIVCTAILILSVLDGILTVHLTGLGIKQGNPVLTYFVTADAGVFALIKVALTAVGLVGLVLTAHMRIYQLVQSSTVLYAFLSAYVITVVYQAYLAQGVV